MRTAVDVDLASRTDAGRVREKNEDTVLLGELDGGDSLEPGLRHELEVERGLALIVCDGMGGVSGGEVASQLAARSIFEQLRASPLSSDRLEMARHLRRAVRVANRRVRGEAEREVELRGMGTTVSAALVSGDVALIAQVGDSRAYLHRRGKLTQITRDQSVVSALLHAGRLTEKEAKNSAQRGMILQALGSDEDVDVAISIAELRRGDYLLLCSDGLHSVVGDDLIARALDVDSGAEVAAGELVDLALQAGGPDNISVIIASVDGESLRDVVGDDDQPAFTELDPAEDGDAALVTTSKVGRRLAHRAGLRTTSPEMDIPATGQHAIVRVDADDPPLADSPVGPATRALQSGQRIGVGVWLAAASLAAAIIAFLLWGAF